MSLTAETVPPPVNAAIATRQTFQERWRGLFQLLIAAELVVLFAPTVAWLIDRWTISVWQNAHGMFVPPVAAWFAWQELKRFRGRPVEGSRWGFALVLPALAIHAIDAGMHTQLLSAMAFFLAIPGLCLLVLGVERTRAIAFPLSFLLFAIPIPLAFT